MRIDKFLSDMGVATRKETAQAARKGAVRVNSEVCRNPDRHIDPEKDTISYFDRVISYERFRYIMLNKPDGYVSATDDGSSPTVLELLPEEYRKFDLFPCGRLDKHTLGLMLITDNGELAHRLLSPKHHVSKTYAYESKFPLSESDRIRLEGGVTLDDGYETLPAKIELNEDGMSGKITLTEGKYHQIKRMFEAVGNKITALERITFGPLVLDTKLERGQWRRLTKEEVGALEAHGK